MLEENKPKLTDDELHKIYDLPPGQRPSDAVFDALMEKYRDHKPTMNFLRVMDQRTGIADRNIKWLNRSLAVHRLWGKLTAPFHPGRFRNR